jgi:proliferating cell nuclear antigen|uniref:Proliferating cell nuclear antigen PCNA N-terminal domain-containing protein n=1 Tax=viral metagenome TaxID=1070528 RepID=A0A6C0AJE6_9ZZZZ
MPEFIVEAKTVQTGAVRTLTEALKCILVEMSLIFDSEGIRMVAMDNTRTVLVHLRLYAEKFEKFVYNHPQSKFVIGINSDHLHRIVRTATNDDTITFYVDQADPNTLGILLEDGEKKQVTRYKLNLLDRDEPDIQLPETEFSAHITMPSLDFQKICRDMTLLGAKTVEIKNVGSSLTFGCKGHFASRTTVMGDSENEFSIQKKENSEIVTGNFSLPHLVLFTKCTNLCNNLEIHMKNDWFLMIRYVVANLGDTKLCLMPCST